MNAYSQLLLRQVRIHDLNKLITTIHINVSYCSVVDAPPLRSCIFATVYTCAKTFCVSGSTCTFNNFQLVAFGFTSGFSFAFDVECWYCLVAFKFLAIYH